MSEGSQYEEKRAGMWDFHCVKNGMLLESREEVRKRLQLQQQLQ